MRTEKEKRIFKAALALPYKDRVTVLCILLDDLRKHREELARKKKKPPAAMSRGKTSKKRGGRS